MLYNVALPRCGNTCRVSADADRCLVPDPTVQSMGCTHQALDPCHAGSHQGWEGMGEWGAENHPQGAVEAEGPPHRPPPPPPPTPAHTTHAPLFHQTSLTNGKFKDKRIKNFEKGPSKHGAPCDSADHTSTELVLTASLGAHVLLQMQTRCPFSPATCWQLAFLCLGKIPWVTPTGSVPRRFSLLSVGGAAISRQHAHPPRCLLPPPWFCPGLGLL